MCENFAFFSRPQIMSSKHEHEQGINEITFTKNGEMYIYEHGGLKLFNTSH